MKQSCYFLSLLFFFSANIIFAQVSEGGIPYSIANSLSYEGERVEMPFVDKDALLAEDALEEGKNIPYRFGYPIEVNYNLQNSGTWQSLPDGSRLWRLNIYSPNATTINLIYNDFWLPSGGKFYLYNESRSEVIGAFTERNNKEDGYFATGLIRGESIYLEYHEPANVSSPGFINISTVVHGYKNIFSFIPGDDFGQSGSCNINVNCPQGDPWANEIRAAAMILTASNSRLCSGSMVNNARQDLTPYFLTANHCMSGSPSTWILMFRYQSPTCSNIDGPLVYTVQGTTTKAQNSASDFALLLLNEAPPDSYQVHFAGWSAVDVPSTNSVGIHHPRGDIKKICFDNDPPTSHAWTGTPDNSHWRIGVWDAGTTEPGSSGSPLYDQNKRITGQLHGGLASCTVLDYDSYGKFAFSWNYGSTPATRLKDWLDPDNTGILFLDGWDPSIGDPDTIPPTVITDLAVVDPTSNSLTLNWSAPLDTSYGGVRLYDIRYSSSPITDTISFYNATQIPFSGSPAAPGTPESFMVSNLNFNNTLYFAICSKDTWNNWSNVSNSPSGTTLSAPAASAAPDSLSHILEPNSTKVDSFIISNSAVNPSTLDYQVTLDNNSFPNGMLNYKIVPVVKEELSTALNYEKDKYEEINGSSIEGLGGPDNFGYIWIDSDEPNGPAYVWNDISSTGTAVTNWTATGTFDPKDEGIAGPFPLGFSFKFYGNSKNDIYINTNGIVLFGTVSTNIYSNAQIPTAAVPNEFIAPFWDDLDGRTQGTVHYKADPDKFTIQFTNWQKYSGTGSLTFQTVLYKNGKILIYYNNMAADLNSATVGIENAGGNDGLQIAYNAAYVKNNHAIKISADPEWVTAGSTGGTLYNGNSAAVILTFKSEDYPEGNYSMDFIISSNDPVNPVITLPVYLVIDDEVPVELVSFNAEVDNNNINFSWVTATETNNSGFSIERKTSASEWAEAAFVKGNGTTTNISSYSYQEKDLSIGKYSYRLKQVDYDGTASYCKEIELEILPPKEFSLFQNFPNPFNPATTIKFSLPEKSNVVLTIYNGIGEKVREVLNGSFEPGYHEAVFDASQLSSGIYFYKLDAGKFSSIKKMALLK